MMRAGIIRRINSVHKIAIPITKRHHAKKPTTEPHRIPRMAPPTPPIVNPSIPPTMLPRITNKPRDKGPKLSIKLSNRHLKSSHRLISTIPFLQRGTVLTITLPFHSCNIIHTPPPPYYPPNHKHPQKHSVKGTILYPNSSQT